MRLDSVLHRPMSEFAHAVDETKYVFRLRAGRDDIERVVFGYADRAAMTPSLSFENCTMNKVRADKYYDWFEIEIDIPYERVAYYFELSDGKEKIFYLGDCFEKDTNVGRSEYFQLPFNLRNDRLEIPEWTGDAIVYNIFPDSFASGKRYISRKSKTLLYEGEESSSNLGGTVRGIIENLDYIKELGCNCIYFNPLFAATSYHKYDTLDYFHIDPTRGSDGDFKELVTKAHSMNIKIIVDGVFNHVCYRHPFFRDVMENGDKSIYKEYFYDLGQGKVEIPEPGQNPTFTCFAYVPQMPKTNTANKELRDYFCKVGAYWVKEFDVDGWRLDVANEVDDEFLRKFRNTVKSAKKEAIVIGEVWENASHYINANMLDGAMNYDFRRFVGQFIAEEKIDAEEFDARISNLLFRYPKQAMISQLNLLDSHDVSRYLSVCNGDIDKMELSILFQMTFTGMPSIFYGDEAGLMGESESEYRQAMQFDNPCELREIYKRFIALRKQYPEFRKGTFNTIIANDKLYGFSRYYEGREISVYMNVGENSVQISPKGQVLLKKHFECGLLKSKGYIISIVNSGE